MITIFLLLLFRSYASKTTKYDPPVYPAIETCKTTPLKGSKFCDESLTIDERVEDLIDILCVEEKVILLSYKHDGVTRLNISGVYWGNEALHGVCHSYDHKVTSFPQVINLGRTFNIPLVKRMAQAISDEGRALHNIMKDNVAFPSFWSPNINVFRDPRWGRGQETPGEDPLLVSRYAEAYVTGLQEGEDSNYIKILSCAKHFIAYDMERWPYDPLEPPPPDQVDRHHFNAIVTEQDMEESFAAPFRKAVEDAKVGCIMCSYNRVNGVPACADTKYQTDLLRSEWNFEGHVVSDCHAVDDVYLNHKYVKSEEEATQVTLQAGTDLDCGKYYEKYLGGALEKHLISEADIDVALSRVLRNRLRLGEFDDWEKQKYRSYGAEKLNSKKHQELALELALESIVLLKNANSTLPLTPSSRLIKNLAVIGPAANGRENSQGGRCCGCCGWTVSSC